MLKVYDSGIRMLVLTKIIHLQMKLQLLRFFLSVANENAHYVTKNSHTPKKISRLIVKIKISRLMCKSNTSTEQRHPLYVSPAAPTATYYTRIAGQKQRVIPQFRRHLPAALLDHAPLAILKSDAKESHYRLILILTVCSSRPRINSRPRNNTHIE
jgi:hypothetical protein